jgi:Peptidase family M23
MLESEPRPIAPNMETFPLKHPFFHLKTSLNKKSAITLSLLGCLLFGAMPASMAAAPLTGQVTITSPFGWRGDPFNGSQKFHSGVDIAAETGTPVVAAQAGYVVFSGQYGGYGEAVVIDHGQTLYTLYGHNSERLVSAGQYVSAGQIIARVGSTGRATGPHLHFEVHYNRQYMEPLAYLNSTNSALATSQPMIASNIAQGGPPVPGGTAYLNTSPFPVATLPQQGSGQVQTIASLAPYPQATKTTTSTTTVTHLSPWRRWFHRGSTPATTTNTTIVETNAPSAASGKSTAFFGSRSAPRISNYSSPVIKFVGMENALVPPTSGVPVPIPQPKREDRRRVAPVGTYGHNAVEVVKGSQIETVRF